jgi:hypothetical protein|tara:strand:- start:4364 stop:4684 length:321 start_codon:yes stop_codon:yes gene_type:complete
MPVNTQRDIEEYFLEHKGYIDFDEYSWVEEFKVSYGYDPCQEQYKQKPKRVTTPKTGHLVRFSNDIGYAPAGTTGLIVDTNGIEIQVMMADNRMVWIQRDLAEVIE